MATTITIYCTIDPICLTDKNILSRLSAARFKSSTKQANLFYRTLYLEDLQKEPIHVSYYYYLQTKNNHQNKCITNRNLAFDALCRELVTKEEANLKFKSFNNQNGYTEEYFQTTNRA